MKKKNLIKKLNKMKVNNDIIDDIKSDVFCLNFCLFMYAVNLIVQIIIHAIFLIKLAPYNSSSFVMSTLGEFVVMFIISTILYGILISYQYKHIEKSMEEIQFK